MMPSLRIGQCIAALRAGSLTFLIVLAAACPASKAADPSSPVAERKLGEPQKIALQRKLQQRVSKEKIAALQELGGYPYDLEAVKLIVHISLRDQADAVCNAATEAVLESKRSPAVGLFLIDRLDQEVNTKRRPNLDYLQRLAALTCRFHFPEVYQDLLKFVEESEMSVAQTVVSTIMGEFDRASLANDPTITPLNDVIAKSKLFGNVYGVRRCVIDAAIRIRTNESVTFLVQQQKLLEGEIRHGIVQHLRAISEQQFPVGSNEWQRWWKENQATFKFPEKISSMSKVVEDGTPRYYDMPINAKRLVFILDTSKSMEAGDPYTMLSRLEAAKRELINTIDQLPDTTLFNLVIFNTTTFVWQDRLARATDRWKLAAKQFVSIQRANGKTSTYDALLSAYGADSNVEAFYLLSDGAPSSGTIIPPLMILDAIRTQNHMRRVTINTIGVYGGGEDSHEPFMKSLAEQNLGQYRRAN